MFALPWLPGLRNPPRPLLVAGPSSTGSSDSDGGLFAVPTTLPPNSRHGKLYSPSKETELTFRQHLNSISVSRGAALPLGVGAPHPGSMLSGPRPLLADAVRFLPAEAQEAAEPAPAEATGGAGQGTRVGLGTPPSGSPAGRADSPLSREPDTGLDPRTPGS